MHETITLQFGQQANYLGTHYWNVQESYFTYAGQEDSPVDHDVSFRAGTGADGNDTYTPRAIIYDLKGAFGTMRQENALYQLQQQDGQPLQSLWSTAAVPLRLPAIAPSSYQQALDQGTEPPRLTTGTVRFWSDYNHLFYHPKSIVQLNEYELNSSLMPFERWSAGEELFSSLDREHDLLDRDLRPFLEDCDQLQGLQIITGIDDAWGGFASRYLESIADDLGKGCRWVFGLKSGSPATRERSLMQSTYAAQSIYAFDSTASVHIPLTSVPSATPSYLRVDSSSPWISSAMQATVLESLTLPTRLRHTEAARATFDQLETYLNNEGHRRIAILEAKAHDPASMDPHGAHDTRVANGLPNGASHDTDEEASEKTDITFFPSFVSVATSRGGSLRRHPHIFTRIEALRGHWMSAIEIEEANFASRDRFASGPRTSVHQSELLFPLLSSYPRIFNFPSATEKLAIKTQLTTSTAVADQLHSLGVLCQRSVAVEEREALCDGLASIAEEYVEGWDSSDDGDDND